MVCHFRRQLRCLASIRRMSTIGNRHWMQRRGDDVSRQSKSSQECGENCRTERFALPITVFCSLRPDQS